MNSIKISDLFVYPLKSSKGILLDTAEILSTGFEFDRNFGVLNQYNDVLTARENAKLLHINTKINKKQLTLFIGEKESVTIDFSTEYQTTEIQLFKKKTFGKLVNEKANIWLSEVLEEPCKLVKIDSKNLRKVNFENVDNAITFSDCFPIHLVTTASIKALNSDLNNPIIDNRFRPNIIISGTQPYEEYNWKNIRIGNCEFDVITPTNRCSLITIDTVSLEKDKQQEPLRTLAKNKTNTKKVAFGVYLIPKTLGTIYKNDIVTLHKIETL